MEYKKRNDYTCVCYISGYLLVEYSFFLLYNDHNTVCDGSRKEFYKKKLFQVSCLILLALMMLPLSQKISETQILAADEGAVQIGKENPKYTFNTINGERISTQSEDGRTTVLLFGFTTCGWTKTTLKNIVASPLITAEDIRTIFIECTGVGQEEVTDFKETKCQDTSDKIIYCYHEGLGVVEKVRNDYLDRFGGNTESHSYPVIILIDKNNRARQFIQTGSSVTAETLKSEIDKLADPDPGEPSSGPESPVPTIPQPGLGEDPDYTFCSIEGEKIPTTYREIPKKNTVLIFGKTNCGKTKATVQEIADSNWAGNEDIRVFFAEATGKTRAEATAFAERYKGSSITFCYDDGETGLDSIYNAMFRYARFDAEIGNSVSFPLIILIDENSRVRKVVQGYQTAGYIKGGLYQIIDPSTTPEPLPTATPQPDPVAGLTSISGDTVPMKPSPGKTTTLIFGTITSKQSGNIEVRSMASADPSDAGPADTVSNERTLQTLKNILESDLYKKDKLHVVFAECGKATREEIEVYAAQFKDDPNIRFCYAEDIEDGTEGNEIQKAMDAYAGIFRSSAGSLELPFTVLIDDEDHVQNALEGPLTAEDLSREINGDPGPEETPSPIVFPTPSSIPSHIPTDTPTAIVTPGPTDTPEPTDTPVPTDTPTPTDTPAPTDTPKPTDTPVPTDTLKPVSVPKVSGLKTVSSKSSIKLKWNKIPGVKGYIVYQYKNSGWKQIASVRSEKTVYTVRKLKSGKNHRFAIRAYINQGQEQYFSKSYTSTYAATKPAAVAFKATVKQNKVTLTWKKVKGATGYKIRYRSDKDEPWKTLKNTKGTKFTSKNLGSGKVYTFTVKPYKTYKGKTYIGNGKTKKVRIR
ncbi:MAG: fibronectin type III domain-containing protein [Oscillospiraceae bacterium]|nr:fibronectin type III domain-containing protein [Oscillospiraceae bacterium]